MAALPVGSRKAGHRGMGPTSRLGKSLGTSDVLGAMCNEGGEQHFP